MEAMSSSKRKYKDLRNLPSEEKKKWRKEQIRTSNNRRVRIGNEFERWIALKETLGLKTDTEVANLLLDWYW